MVLKQHLSMVIPMVIKEGSESYFRFTNPFLAFVGVAFVLSAKIVNDLLRKTKLIFPAKIFKPSALIFSHI